MKRSLKFTVLCALAGVAVAAAVTSVAGAHPSHVYRLRGTSQGADQSLGADASCTGTHMTGKGTTHSGLGDGTYTEDLCATVDTGGMKAFSFTGTYNVTSPKGELHGTATGRAVYSERDLKFHYSIAIAVDGGTNSFVGAHGTLREYGTGEFDNTDGTLVLKTDLALRGVIKA